MTNRLVERAVEALREKIGTVVERVLWTDTSLVLLGPGWRVTTTSPWRITLNGVLVVGAEDTNSEAEASSLSGARLQSVLSSSDLDPQLRFTDGRVLEIFSACTVEPWVVDVSGYPVIVGSPTETHFVNLHSSESSKHGE